MDADLFLQQFGHLAQGDGGIKKLRDVIRSLAIQGRLIVGNRSDSLPKQVIKLASPKGAYDLPHNWRWIQIGKLMKLINGKAFKQSEWSNDGLPIIRIQNLNNENASFNYCNAPQEDRFIVENNTLLISWSGTPGTSFGAFIWSRGKALLNQHIFKVEVLLDELSKEYLKLSVNGRLDEMISKAHGGVGLRHITKGKLEGMNLPIPPLTEQKQIVAKVDELMALCDKLEAEQRAQRTLKKQTVQSTLHHLTSAESPTSFSTSLNILERTFGNWFDDLATVKQLRATILQMAIQGNLTGESETIEIANMPKIWRECKLSDLLSFGPKNGYSPKPVEYDTGTKSLTLSATTSGSFDGSKFKFIDEAIPADSHLWLDEGDILIQRGNSAEYVGVSAIYHGKKGIFIYPDLMMKIRVTKDAIPEYIHLALLAPTTRAYFLKNATGTSGSMPKINQAVVKNTPIPLPSIAEQKRIVAKVDELMTLCDQLEAQITQSQTLNAHLMDSLIHHMAEAA